jgi:hypothetical protein
LLLSANERFTKKLLHRPGVIPKVLHAWDPNLIGTGLLQRYSSAWPHCYPQRDSYEIKLRG